MDDPQPAMPVAPEPILPSPILAELDTVRAEDAMRDEVRALRREELRRGSWKFRLVRGGPR